MRNLIVFLLIAVSLLAYGQHATVEPFLPELFSKFPSVRDLTISADGNELYFTAQSPLGELSTIIQVRKENGKWSEPTIASFSGKWKDLEPFISPDGLRLYFASDRPTSDSATIAKDYDIWYVQRPNKSAKWEAPTNVGAPINTSHNEFYPAIANSGNIYYSTDGLGSKGKDDVFLSTFKDGVYTTPVSLSESINSEGYEFNAYVAPDESFILYSCYKRKDGFGSGDLYISNRNADGSWSKAVNLGESINGAQMDYCPFYEESTGLLYFTSRRSSVRTDLHEFKSIDELIGELDQYANGGSRIYVVKLSKL